MMLLYLTLGSNDLSRSRQFYDATLAPLGLALLKGDDSEIGYGAPGQDQVLVWINRPFDGKPASVGNGSMPAFAAQTRATVDAFHAAALAHGGSDEGGPGLRYAPHFYAAYVRDPDGNKLSAVCIAPE